MRQAIEYAIKDFQEFWAESIEIYFKSPDRLQLHYPELYKALCGLLNQDPLNYPIRLNNKLAALNGVVGGSDSAPTDQALAVYEDIVAKINAQLKKVDDTMRTDLPAFNKLVREQDVPAVIVRAKAK